jgi:ketosteroid isomerase-like protein
MPEGSDAIKGRAAIQKFMQGVIDSGVASVSLTTLEKFGSGSTATEVGVYEMHDKAGKAVDHGKYLVLWRKVNGAWQLHRDIFNSSVPPSK